MVDEDEVTPRDGETEKTPCEILKEKMKEARGDEGIAPNQYGGTGCHNGKVLVCVFPEEFVQPGDDPHGAAIASVCISAHEHHHSKQAKYDPDGTGVYPPENDLKCDEAEREALEAEIDCYNSQELSLIHI